MAKRLEVMKTLNPRLARAAVLMNPGGLVAYGVDFPHIWRRSMIFVDKILKGAKPDPLPIEQAQKFELVINVSTAKILGVTVPQALVLRADQVIQ